MSLPQGNQGVQKTKERAKSAPGAIEIAAVHAANRVLGIAIILVVDKSEATLQVDPDEELIKNAFPNSDAAGEGGS